MLDAYWFARAFLYRALRIACEAHCASTIGRRLDSALRRAIRCIIDAADGTPDKADARLQRACAAICLALTHFEELSVEKGVDDVVIEDLREHAGVLIERLKTLEGKPIETWSASNCLSTVLPQAVNQITQDVDIVAAVARLPDTATRELPRPIVRKNDAAQVPAHQYELASGSPSRGKEEKVVKPPTADSG